MGLWCGVVVLWCGVGCGDVLRDVVMCCVLYGLCCVVLCCVVLWCVVVCCGVAWCCVVLRGVAWCCVVLRGVAWCCVVLRGVAWCCVVLRGVAVVAVVAAVVAVVALRWCGVWVVWVVRMINGNGVSVQARSYVQLIGWQNTWEQAPGVPNGGLNPGRVPVYTALPAHPEQASQDLLDPHNRNIDHPARTATAKSLWSARQA